MIMKMEDTIVVCGGNGKLFVRIMQVKCSYGLMLCLNVAL